MKKNLYRLGLPPDALEHQDGQIMKLLNRRNDIAHGSRKDGLTAVEYDELERAVMRVMDDLLLLVVDSLRDKVYEA